MKTIKRTFTPPKGSYFLFGPRGTGKSTWIKKNYSSCFYVDLLLPDLFRSYSANPEKLKKLLDADPKVQIVVIDEVQKVPELLSVVHSIIEEGRSIQFILTGSSARKLKKTGVNLLAGRAIKRSMYPFIASELGEDFTLDSGLRLGMLPVVWGSLDPKEALETYVSLYIIEEVRFEGLVRNIGGFSRFLSVIAFSHASLLNVTNIASECEIKRNAVEEYIGILEDLLLAYLLPVFTNRAQRSLVSHPKFYLFDAGVFRVLRGMGPADKGTELDGLALESLVLQHLKAWQGYCKDKFEIFFWRTKAGLEVDFIIYGETGFWAIEVKNGEKVSSKDVRGLLHFQEDYPECKLILLHRGKDKWMEKGVLCFPVETFLSQVLPNAPLF